MDLTNIVLEMQERIIKLEKEVAWLNEQISSKSLGIDHFILKREESSDKSEGNKDTVNKVRMRDKTRYLYDDSVYLKNHLVFAIVRDYVNRNSPLTREELMQAFPKRLQGSIGVVVNIEKAKIRGDYNLRFFTDETEILHLCDGEMVVCSQWGIVNIPYFIEQARLLGYKITEIKQKGENK